MCDVWYYVLIQVLLHLFPPSSSPPPLLPSSTRYGHAMVRKIKKRTMETDGESKDTESASTSSDGAGLELFAGLEDEFKCWMSHGDKLTALPAGYEENTQEGGSERRERREGGERGGDRI